MPGLTDDEVVSELRKMTAFIKQEALEKAREIKVKADEEFSIEKAKIVRQESINIDATLERKKKQIEIEKKIAISNQNNKSRLQLLEKREELLEKVFDQARDRIGQATKNEKKYAELLKRLVLQVRCPGVAVGLTFDKIQTGPDLVWSCAQAMFTIMEKDVKVSGRQRDEKLLEKAAKEAVKEFEKQTGWAPKFAIETDLNDKSAGGVIIKGYGSRITVNNTLDERLRLLEEKMLPELRESLFGKNENRRFYS